jgi:hypothetical protein
MNRVRFLLDTNVVSEPSKARPNSRVIEWVAEWPSEDLAVSSITFGEIQLGISLLDPGRRRETLIRWLEEEVAEQFRDRVLPVDETVAREWGRLSARAERKGRPLSVEDGLLLATAAIYELVLVTRNERHFRERGVDILNPWER